LLEDIEETVGEDESQKRYSEAELSEMLRAALTADELDMTQALLEGFTQKEIAETLGLTQQAVGARLKKIRAKLKGILEGL
ncbi:MAG: sigma factor-like helix-turn-helix DNA-binding protein, partial [Cloacibacillus sp.]